MFAPLFIEPESKQMIDQIIGFIYSGIVILERETGCHGANCTRLKMKTISKNES
jgi:hypothetical protein